MKLLPRVGSRSVFLVTLCQIDCNDIRGTPTLAVTEAFQVPPAPFCYSKSRYVRRRLASLGVLGPSGTRSRSIYQHIQTPSSITFISALYATASEDVIDVNATTLGDESDVDEEADGLSDTTAQEPDDTTKKTSSDLRDLGQAFPFSTYSGKFLEDNGLELIQEEDGTVTARPKDYAAGELTIEDDEKLVVHDINDVDAPAAEMEYDEDFQRLFELDDEAETDPPVKRKRTFPKFHKNRPVVKEHPAHVVPASGFNVVLTHCTADFDSLASAVGLAKLWSAQNERDPESIDKADYDSSSDFPTFVVLPRGAHPSVQRFLALHKHLFPIRSLRSLPSDLSGLNRLGLVDAQRRDRVGPAEPLLKHAKRVTIVDHHIDSDSDIPEATDYVVDKVGSVSTLIAERLMSAELDEGLSEAEATLLALGIHADTGSLCYDSTTPRDAVALAWVMKQGASQAAIAEHAQASLSPEQQGVLTQALINTNSTDFHGVTVSTVLLTADGFINGLAAVTQDAMELSSSDVYLLGLVYEAKSGGSRKKSTKKQKENFKSRLLQDTQGFTLQQQQRRTQMRQQQQQMIPDESALLFEAKGMEGGEEALMRERLRAAFDKHDINSNDVLEEREISTALAASGIIVSDSNMKELMKVMDTNGDGVVDFEEFVNFAKDARELQLGIGPTTYSEPMEPEKRPCTLIIIGRVKAGVNMKSVNLGKLLESFGGGGHAKAASATVRLSDESEAAGIMDGLVRDLVQTSLQEQPVVGDFMTAPVLSVKPDMTEVQVENLFVLYDVRALPVIDEDNNVIGLVTYKEVAAAKKRLWNKEQKRMRQEKERHEKEKKESSQEGGDFVSEGASPGRKPQTAAELAAAQELAEKRRKLGSSVKGWMKQHIQTVERSCTMAEVESILLENDVGCIPVVEDGTMKLLGMVSRTDLLRQHRYYSSLHYHNKGFSDSIAKRKPIIELRKYLKRFDID